MMPPFLEARGPTRSPVCPIATTIRVTVQAVTAQGESDLPAESVAGSESLIDSVAEGSPIPVPAAPAYVAARIPPLTLHNGGPYPDHGETLIVTWGAPRTQRHRRSERLRR